MAAELMGVTVDRTITDAKGRRLGIRELDVMEELDLYEIAGPNSTNGPWLGTAMMVCTVRTLNDARLPFPTNRNTLRGALGRLGREGVDALHSDLSAQRKALEAAIVGEDQAGDGEMAGEADAAKN